MLPGCPCGQRSPPWASLTPRGKAGPCLPCSLGRQPGTGLASAPTAHVPGGFRNWGKVGWSPALLPQLLPTACVQGGPQPWIDVCGVPCPCQVQCQLWGGWGESHKKVLMQKGVCVCVCVKADRACGHIHIVSDSTQGRGAWRQPCKMLGTLWGPEEAGGQKEAVGLGSRTRRMWVVMERQGSMAHREPAWAFVPAPQGQ